MRATQLYETTVLNRDSGEAFSFVTVPGRSLIEPIAPTASAIAEAVGVQEVRPAAPAEPWSIPFLIDVTLGHPPEFPWILEPGGPRQGQTPTPFAQYLAYEPVIPFEESPLRGKSLAAILGPTGGATVAVGFLAGQPLIVVLVPAGIILCGAAYGIAEALHIGLRARILELMGVEDPERPGRSA